MMKMSLPMRRLCLIACFLLAPIASAETLHLIAPQKGVTLRGGSFATIEWTAAELPRGAEEWEAFLSLDGGKYYAFRITPHLDLALKRFSWMVPNAATNDARILIRTGDERHETLVEFPIRFSIAAVPHAELCSGLPPRSSHAEAARDGDPNVIAWVDGDRAGTRATQQCARATAPQIASFLSNHERGIDPAVAPKTLHSSAAQCDKAHRIVPRARCAIPVARSRQPADVLLAISRMNV
jgi:hypothetical protein